MMVDIHGIYRSGAHFVERFPIGEIEDRLKYHARQQREVSLRAGGCEVGGTWKHEEVGWSWWWDPDLTVCKDGFLCPIHYIRKMGRTNDRLRSMCHLR